MQNDGTGSQRAAQDRAVSEGALLEGPPPLVRRRSVLAGAAVGITSTVLPHAALAASPGTVEPSGSLTYPSGSEVLLYWTGYDTSGTASQDGTAANATAAAGTWQRGGVNAGSTTVAAAGGGATSASWTIQNAENELTVADGEGDVSPHLQWTLGNTSGTDDLEVTSLVLYRLRNLSKGSTGDLRLAFYVSTAAGFAAPVLRRTISIADNATNHVVVQLGLIGGSVLAPGATATVRAFPYRTATSRDVRFIQHNSTDGGFTLDPLIDGPDDVQNDVIGHPVSTAPVTGDHTVAFIGRTIA